MGVGSKPRLLSCAFPHLDDVGVVFAADRDEPLVPALGQAVESRLVLGRRVGEGRGDVQPEVVRQGAQVGPPSAIICRARSRGGLAHGRYRQPQIRRERGVGPARAVGGYAVKFARDAVG